MVSVPSFPHSAHLSLFVLIAALEKDMCVTKPSGEEMTRHPDAGTMTAAGEVTS